MIYEKTVEELEEENTKLKNEISEMKTENQTQKNELGEMKDILRDLQQQIKTLQESNSELT